MNCELCKRNDVEIQCHHLIPKQTHTRKRKKRISKEQLELTVSICKQCHYQIHKIFDNKYLANNLNTIQLLLENTDVQNWCNWISKKESGFKPHK